MLCEICRQNNGELSAVLGGVYHKHVCQVCKSANNQASSGHARWSRSIDLEDHEHEVQQPYNADGTINTRFAKLYPEQAKALFSAKEIRDANRN